jgi:phthiocerol/phenolphthiocerol synthesis type-I polyketide synthase E
MTDERRIDEHSGFEVAIVGAAGRFPGARGLDEYWENLVAGRETIRRFGRDELIAAGADPDLVDHPSYVPVKPTVGDVDLFDASFFNYSPREAEVIDPQGRMLLELAVEALGDAGYDPQTYEGLVGVFAGGRLSSYMLQVYRNPEAVARSGDFGIQIGGDKDYLATRISYKLDLGGPSVNVQTACSTGLVAVHLACQALIAGECDMALAGASSLAVPEVRGYVWEPGGVNSRRGQIRAFDADADGTIFGNGIGLVALRRLEDAVADRDRILAVIKGSALSNDGARRVGFTAPGVDGQYRVVRAAQLAAEVDADTITYMEAHGTGTAIGDPIEIQALTRAFRETTDRTGYCTVSSVKSNIGHLSSAAGIASLLKAVLALRNRYVPPSIHFERPNPQIDFETSPFVVRTEGEEWRVDGMPRRAGVSAFGIGGTDAHVILEEAPAPARPEPSHRDHQLLVLSARTPSALDRATSELAEHLSRDGGEDREAAPAAALADAAFTLQRGRQAFEQRRFAVAGSRGEAAALLAGERPDAVLSGTVPAEARPVVWMFSGQGSQHPGMGRGLYRAEPRFREAIDRCAEVLAGLPDGRAIDDLQGLLFPGPAVDPDEAAARLERTQLTQPALFAVEYALAGLWRSWGVEPTALVGHSIGEYVAACVAGVMSLEDALAVVAARGRLMQVQPPGDMLSVPLSEQELAGRLTPDVSIAALNAPGRSVVSGPADAVAALQEALEADGIACRPLHTSHAFHSAMMESMLPAFLEVVRGVELHPPSIPFVSNVTGTWISDEEATDPGYWARHVRSAVRFAEGLATLAADGPRIFLEVGPGKSLSTLVRQNRELGGKDGGHLVLSSMRHPKDDSDDDAFALEALGRLWLAGVRVDWDGFHADESRSRVALPTYPFERRSYWIEATEETAFGGSGKIKKRADLGDWFHLPAWRPSVPPAASKNGTGGPGANAFWVLFADASGPSSVLADALTERLTASGRRCARVEPGDGFEELGGGRFRVGSAAEGYGELLAALASDQASDRAGTGESGEAAAERCLVHLWNVGDGADGDADKDPGAAQERGFWSLLGLAKALGRVGDGAKTRLAVVTSGVQQVAREPVTHPERATVIGPVQVAPAENPRLSAAAIDVPASDDPEEAAALASALVAELAAGLPDRLVAYRPAPYGPERWVRGLAPAHLPAAPDELPRLRDGGTYLVTGGLGGFGRTFAGMLAREYGARLVLVGRSALPPREEWDEILASGVDARAARKIESVRELEALGAEVMVESADVTDPANLGDVVRRTRGRFGPIHGVIHAAGVPGGGMIQLKERDAAAAVLAPKLAGTRALEAALAGESPDFLLLCSSTIAVLGGFGQVDYCAANNFLDAYARSRAGANGGGTYTVSVNWGAWKEVGMAVETALPAGAAQAAVGTPAESGTGSGGPALEPFDGPSLHPLLDRRIDDGTGRAVFAVRPGPESHWVLDEHRIQGAPAIPGTTYLEMVRAAFAEAEGEGPAEIRDLLFLTPILVPEGERREVRLALKDPTDGGGGNGKEFRVTSAAGPDGPWTEHARGTVARLADGAPEPVDVEALRERCSDRVLDFPDGEVLSESEKFVYWGPRWKSLRTAHMGDGEGVVRLELPEEFAGDVEALGLHPALVDVATAVGGGALVEGNFLPLSYRRVRVHRPLPAAFDSHVRTTGEAGRETVTLDVSFLGPGGEVLVEVEGFTMKRVGAGALGARAAGAASAAEAAPGASGEEAPRTLFGADGMTPGEGVEVLRRVLAHGRHPQIAVSPRDLEALLAQAAKRPALGLAGDGAGDSDDAAGARDSHPRPELATPYTAPRNPAEETLAGIWASILGVEEVGIHDNFFDLGGDSILGIQIITKAKRAGLELAPEVLFEHQTVAELAAQLPGGAAGADPAAEARPAAEVWDEWLRESAGGWRGALDVWLDADLGPPALRGAAADADGDAERQTVASLLDAASTGRLREALDELRASLEEVVLAALVGAAGGERLWVRLHADGRTVAPPELGLADAADPLPFAFPLLLEARTSDDGAGNGAEPPMARQVRAVKERRRSLPGSGAPWPAWLRHGPDPEVVAALRALPAPRLSLALSATAAPAAEDEGADAPAVELRVREADGRIELDWSFEPSALERHEVEALAADVLERLDRTGHEAHGGDALSTVDFPEADLDQSDLDSVLARLVK